MRVLSYLLTQEGAAATFASYIEPSQFQGHNGWNKEVYSVLTKAVKKLRKLPTAREFTAIFSQRSKEYGRASTTEKLDVMRHLHGLYLLETTAATRVEVGSWIARRQINELATDAATSDDMSEVVSRAHGLMLKLAPLLSGESGGGVLPFSAEYMSAEMSADEQGTRDPFPTGYSRLDQEIDYGGILRGETALVLGNSGKGKSMWLVNIAANSLERGRRVLYVALEGGDQIVYRRMMACVTGIPTREETTRQYREREWQRWADRVGFDPSMLIVRKDRPRAFSVDGLLAVIYNEQVRYGNIDLVIVDYPALLQAKNRYDKKYTAVEELHEDMVILAAEMNVALWASGQANRKGLSEITLTTENLADAYGLIRPYSYSVSVNATVEEEQQDRARLVVIKNRSGRVDYQVPFFFDRKCSRYWQDMEGKILHLNEVPESMRSDGSPRRQKKLEADEPRFKRKSTGEAITGPKSAAG